MARLARIVAPGAAHLATQRGNRGQEVFFGTTDYRVYLELLAEHARAAGTKVLAYCLLPDRVHLILAPRDPDGLRAALGEAHRRYARHINQREGWRDHLWQGRFASFAMDRSWTIACARYVEQAPLRANLARSARAWKWSSARAHLDGQDDGVVRVKPLLKLVPDWKACLRAGLAETDLAAIRAHISTGRPLGGDVFLTRLEDRLGRRLRKAKPGPKPKTRRKASGR